MSRNALSLKDKVRLLNLDDRNIYTRNELAEMFGAGKTQIYRIIRDRENIMRIYHMNRLSDECRRLGRVQGSSLILDQSLLEWLRHLRIRNSHVSGPMVKQAALRMADILGMQNFKASNGWLHGFAKRYKLSFSNNFSRIGSTALELMASWKSKIVDITGKYNAQDIFTVDETGLFVRALPNQLTKYENVRCTKGEMPEERVTVVLCVNMKGEKEKPLVISSLFEGLSDKVVVSPDIEWQYEQRSFITESIMTNWLQRLNRKMGQQGRKVLVFLDHAMSHQYIKMDNVTLSFVHPNFTPTWDPMVMGVARHFKLRYRKRVLQHIAETGLTHNLIDRVYDQINMHEALGWIGGAWNEVPANTIQNSFARAGFPVEQDLSPDLDEESDDVCKHWQSLGILPANILERYISIDRHLAEEAVMDDVVEIVRHFLRLEDCKAVESEHSGTIDPSANMLGETTSTDPLMSVESSATQHEETISTDACKRELEEFIVFN